MGFFPMPQLFFLLVSFEFEEDMILNMKSIQIWAIFYLFEAIFSF